MYEEFYGFSGKPFHLNPDPRFFFESQGHARALAYLRYGVEQGEGFVVVTGDVGTGKTTLARMLHEELEGAEDMRLAQLSVPQCTANELLQMVTDAFGLEHERRTKALLLRQLFDFLQEHHRAGQRALLLIDEVQNLPASALETLRTLSSLQTGERALMQVILLGQAEFRHTLNAPTLTQLRQRVIASCHLLPLQAPSETQAYIEHRLRNAGWSGDPALTDGALHAIHEFTGGTPRRINTLCDRLLLFAFLEEQHRITPDTVAAVIEEIAGDFPVVSGAPDSGQQSAGAAPDEDRIRIARLEKRVRALEEALRGLRAGARHESPERASGEGR